jgi:ribosomal protein L37AE/L43A
MRIEYRRDATIVNKGSVTKGRIDDEESYDVIGYPQPDTRTSNPSFSKEDFKEGVAHYTEDGKLYEGPTHKDASGRLMTGAVHTEDSEYLYHEDELEYDVSTIGGYVDEGIRKRKKKKKSFQEVIECMKCDHSWDMEDGGVDIYICHKCGYDNTPKKKDFASYSDYPESVKNNAKSVLKYVDENGWGSCGTPVGKQRANDLAQGNPISEETIKRMYSYLSRHKLDLESSKSYDDGCGKLMYDSWGGLSALSWSESKINSIEREKMSKQNFKTDDEKRIVIGPAMVPNLNIFRRDKEGNPYYVTFTSDTIKMIMEKYMRNKYIDNNDTEHNGKVAQDVYVIESWIKEDEEDKSNKYGFQDLPIGTWFVSMKVKNDEIWDMVKKKELNGFSVSGFFEEVEQFYKEQEFLKQLSEILKKI